MTEFLPKLETVINEFVENDPDHAGDEEIFDIYLAAINTDTRAALETEHLLWAHLDVRETYLDKVAYVRECLYAKRAKEDDKPKKRTLPPQSPGGQGELRSVAAIENEIVGDHVHAAVDITHLGVFVKAFASDKFDSFSGGSCPDKITDIDTYLSITSNRSHLDVKKG
ncbi:unnamed protein product (mitochondrion) [Plasmodiophora brassicae]|uniref:Uncharacterized protein n=1 Tax=Plasmodiophora brassicae TaxID=37360 RepID=A0A3P3Y5R3_PLABS|nr:unnamed protein product [Plasmodiophora brassicae]